MVEEHFQIYGDYWKMYIATQKIESRNFYLCPPKQNFSAGSFYHPLRHKEITYPPSRSSIFS